MWLGIHHGTGVTGRFTGIRGVRFTGILTTDTILTGITIIILITGTGTTIGFRITKTATTPVSELIHRE
jgi:hypothetical protein